MLLSGAADPGTVGLSALARPARVPISKGTKRIDLGSCARIMAVTSRPEGESSSSAVPARETADSLFLANVELSHLYQTSKRQSRGCCRIARGEGTGGGPVAANGQ